MEKTSGGNKKSNIKKQRSGCSTRHRAGDNQAILPEPELLDCPICYEHFSPPVFQCKNGHASCGPCCSKLRNKCPVCACATGFIRCLLIEKLAESAMHPCQYAHYGCPQTLTYAHKAIHEQTCSLAPCECPVTSCTFVAPYARFSAHFRDHHSSCVVRFLFNKSFSICIERGSSVVVLLEEGPSGCVFLLNNYKKLHLGNYINVSSFGSSAATGLRCFYSVVMSLGDESTLVFESYTQCVRRRGLFLPTGQCCLTVPSELVDSSHGRINFELKICSFL